MKNIILGTSNYSNCKSGNLLSITGDGGNAWGYFGNAYKKLAPRLTTYTEYASSLLILSEIKDYDEYKAYREFIEDEYIKNYYITRLRDISISDLLYALEDKFGDNIILLCHEDIDEFCHRRVLADYIEITTGIYIPELIEEDSTYKKVNPIRYKNRILKIMNEM